jgi:hypothetical protein
MLLSASLRMARQAHGGLEGHFLTGTHRNPHGAAGGFHLRRVSPGLHDAMQRAADSRPVLKTRPDAVGADGERAEFDWQGVAWTLESLPGEALWEANGGFDADALVRRLARYDLLVLTFAAPLLNVELARKYLYGLTAAYQRPELAHGFTGAVENAVRLAFGLSPEGFRAHHPLEYATVAAHEGSTLRWESPARGGRFTLQAVRKGATTAPGAALAALDHVAAQQVRRTVANLELRHALPLLADRSVCGLTHADLAEQFIPAITRDDWDAAVNQLWGAVDRHRSQEVLLPNAVIELQPAGTAVPARDAAGKPVLEDGKPALTPVAAVIREPNLIGAERLWAGLFDLLARRKAAGLMAEPAAKPGMMNRMFGRRTSANGSKV